jgi:hypothetical protein
MFRRARILLRIAAGMAAMPVAAQAPAATPTAFDGECIGTAAILGGRGSAWCSTITSVDMTIKDGQAVIHEFPFNGGMWTFRGSIDAAGEISTSLWTSWRPWLVDTLSGKIEGKVFAGQHLHGYGCHWSVQMAPPPPPTMPFDGD